MFKLSFVVKIFNTSRTGGTPKNLCNYSDTVLFITFGTEASCKQTDVCMFGCTSTCMFASLTFIVTDSKN